MLELIKGDITKIKADAIVNSANSSLLGGGGVDGAIHRVGGIEIREACRKIRDKQSGCKIGQAVITTAGKLPAKFVIHAVGLAWNNGRNHEESLLFSAYHNSIKFSLENPIRSISFPNISAGIYKFPKKKAALIAIKTICDFLAYTDKIEKVVFVCLDDENYKIYSELLNA